MKNGLKKRKELFEKLLDMEFDSTLEGKRKQNNIYWEMLCCSSKPLVPFVGAGVSAWCYETWKGLLKTITKEIFSEKCLNIVNEALKCEEKPYVENIGEFYWMEEIAECIFEENREEYKKSITKFSIIDVSTQNRNKTNENNTEYFLNNNGQEQKNMDEKAKEEIGKKRQEATEVLKKLRTYIGEESDAKKRKARKALYRKFDKALLREQGNLPEYQRYFPILFSNLLITTNYDHALECCYPSILNYSYNDLKNTSTDEDKSWLFQAVCGKLENMNEELNSKEISEQKVTIPDMPMLLKLHGSIEKINDIALARKGYEKAYKGEMPELIEHIFKNSTLLFLGYSLNDDRIMAEFKKYKRSAKNVHHFAFLPIEERKIQGKLENEYGIYPIYFDKNLLKDTNELNSNYYNYFLGLLLENLSRRQKKYPQPLELLWEEGRFADPSSNSQQSFLLKKQEPYIRYKEAQQIWRNLNDANNNPLIAIIGEEGYGKSTLCRSIQALQENNVDPLQFFYINLRSCKTWNEFCIRIYEELNMIELETPDIHNWKIFAEKVSNRCDVYWKSVLILDHLDELTNNRNLEIWKAIKNILIYWTRKKTHVIFVSSKYPEGIPCHIWNLKKLEVEEKKQLFFSVCTSSQNRNISYLEKKVVSELFMQQSFRPHSITLLGKYANSKNDLTSLLEEWIMYHKQEDSGDYTLAWILWNHLLDEHQYHSDSTTDKERKAIQDNLLWVWEILGDYPGVFPSQFFESLYQKEHNEPYQKKELTEKSLMLMKNIGLCEEKIDEEQMILFDNMKNCVEKYFKSFVKTIEEKEPKKQSKDSNKKQSEKQSEPRNFRGYYMHGWSVKLKQYIYKELKGTEHENNNSEVFHSDPLSNILKILKELSEHINTKEKRAINENLDLVLHYEIKSIIRFLCSCFARMEKHDKDNKESSFTKDVINTVYNFSAYYHLIPNYAYFLMEYILKTIKEENKQVNPKFVIENYKIAQMNLIMGDIQRLLGRKDSANFYYQKALAYCNKEIIDELVIFQNETNEIYKETFRIKADTQLAINCYINEYELDKNENSDESFRIYKVLNDQFGQAYWYQRRGEILYQTIEEIYEEPGSHMKEKLSELLKEIEKNYNKALELYENCNYQAGCAYIYKCKGDVYVEYLRLKENNKRNIFLSAANNYQSAFDCYCNSINWRGFANVIQSMETCCRYYKDEECNSQLKGELYGYAEECYRWLGDIRGLADTLDYMGYEYKECGNKYKALSLWGESKDLWKILGNNKKIEQAKKEITALKKELSNN